MIYDIIEELNKENGKIYKMDVLRKHADNELLKRVLKMAYDKVTYTYGITLKNIDHPGFEREAGSFKRTLPEVLDYLENNYVTRNVTGHDAIDIMSELLFSLTIKDRRVLHGIIDRDQKINMGCSNINKVFKNLIIKPLYMRCGIFTKKTAAKIDFSGKGALAELKADGTYRKFKKEGNDVTCASRSGEVSNFPFLNADMVFEEYKDGYYEGELLVIENGEILPRSIGNGLINSSNPPHDKIIFQVWDYISLDEYAKAVDDVNRADRKKTTTVQRETRLEQLEEIVSSDVQSRITVIEYEWVTSIKEAMAFTARQMKLGKEGGVLKDRHGCYRDGTSPYQLKMKLEIELEMRITGFKEGKTGTIRAETFGSMYFANDEGTIKGSVSGFDAEQLAYFNARRKESINMIITIKCNDITKGRSNDYYALSHPRVVEVRHDRTTTDTLERALELKEMAMLLS